MKRLFLLIFTVISLVSTAFAGSLHISVLYPNNRPFVMEGETFHLKITATDIPEEVRQPKDGPGWKVVYFLSGSMSVSSTTINGKTTTWASGEYICTLKATKSGTYNYALTLGGVKSNSLKIIIKPAGTVQDKSTGGNDKNAQPADVDDDDSTPKFIGQGDNNLFMRAQVSKTTCYEQEALVYTLKLYSSYPQIKFIGATSAPKFDGFVVESSNAVDKALHTETYNGRTYQTAVVARYIIFPQSPGKKTVKGNTYTISVDKRMYYHDSYFGNISYGVPLQLNITPNNLEVDVKALPEPRPAGFCGGVGHFNISSDLPSDKWKSNQAANITYTVNGSGNLKYINAPDLQAIYPSQIEVYSPTSKVKDEVSANDVSGFVTYDYSLMPTEEGDFTLPAVNFVYFDPDKGEYVTSTSRSYNVTVGKGETSAKSQSREKHVFNPDLMTVGTLSQSHTPYIYGFPYWLLYIIPTILLAFGYVGYTKYASIMADQESLQARRARRLSEKWLKTAKEYARLDNRDKFYDSLLEALWGYLGNKLKIKSSLLTRNNVEEILREKGVDDSIVESVIDIINKAEFVKYTTLDSGDDMNKLVDEASVLIGKVESGFRKKKGTSAVEGHITDINALSDKDVKSIRKEIHNR